MDVYVHRSEVSKLGHMWLRLMRWKGHMRLRSMRWIGAQTNINEKDKYQRRTKNPLAQLCDVEWVNMVKSIIFNRNYIWSNLLFSIEIIYMVMVYFAITCGENFVKMGEKLNLQSTPVNKGYDFS